MSKAWNWDSDSIRALVTSAGAPLLGAILTRGSHHRMRARGSTRRTASVAATAARMSWRLSSSPLSVA